MGFFLYLSEKNTIFATEYRKSISKTLLMSVVNVR